MLQAINYCKCGRMLEHMKIILKVEDNIIVLPKNICPHCLKVNVSKEELEKWFK